ncbi:MAG TPA: hypothetical protein VFW64_14125 [Pseudonocardiaceae bacterium]|nr:hypothetical protein [Pseudonocardiaceae bacterium]
MIWCRLTWSGRPVDGLLADLCELGIDHLGGITLQPLDTVLSDAADAAALAAPGEPADAVVWEELIARTGDDSRLTFTSWRSSPWLA